jgi:hypothetical protein
MKNSFQMINRVAVITGLVLGAFALAALANWTSPGAPGAAITPPNCPTGDYGCDAPINVGSIDQVKDAGLSVKAFTAYLNSYFAANVGIGVQPTAKKLEVGGEIHASGDVCTDLAGGKCLSTAGGGSPSFTVTEFKVTNTLTDIGVHKYCALSGLHNGWSAGGVDESVHVYQFSGSWRVQTSHATFDLYAMCLD